MKRFHYLLLVFCLMITPCFASGIKIQAKEFGPELVRKDFDLTFASTMKGNGKYKGKVLYIAQYQILKITITNDTEKVLNVNPNHFTLVSDMKRSYPYSSETHSFKDKVGFIAIDPIQAVDVYPGTMTDGFLVFEKNFENERPKKLYFKNLDKHLEITVELDPKYKPK